MPFTFPRGKVLEEQDDVVLLGRGKLDDALEDGQEGRARGLARREAALHVHVVVRRDD